MTMTPDEVARLEAETRRGLDDGAIRLGYKPGAMPDWIEAVMPRVLPDEWRAEQRDAFFNDADESCGRFFVNDRRRLRVGLSAAVELDERRWLHMSMSHADRVPTWAEFTAAKEVFIGKDRKAIQVIPRRSEYVNIHPYVLHLFAPLEHDPLPDFTRGKGRI